MPWLLASPGHQQPWYCPRTIGRSFLTRGRISITCACPCGAITLKSKYLCLWFLWKIQHTKGEDTFFPSRTPSEFLICNTAIILFLWDMHYAVMDNPESLVLEHPGRRDPHRMLTHCGPVMPYDVLVNTCSCYGLLPIWQQTITWINVVNYIHRNIFQCQCQMLVSNCNICKHSDDQLWDPYIYGIHTWKVGSIHWDLKPWTCWITWPYTTENIKMQFKNKILYWERISMKFIPSDQNDNRSPLVQVMAWHWLDYKSYFMMTQFTGVYICQ